MRFRRLFSLLYHADRVRIWSLSSFSSSAKPWPFVSYELCHCVSLNHCRAYVPTHMLTIFLPCSFIEQPVFGFVRSMSRLSSASPAAGCDDRFTTMPRCVANICRRTRSERSYAASVCTGRLNILC